MTLDGQELKQTLPSFLKHDFEKIEIIGVLDKSRPKKLGGVPKGEWTFGLTKRQQDYVRFKFKGFKPKKENKETVQQWIKNPWKYLAETGRTWKSKNYRMYW